jgi:polar amino acid transport system permease protein
MLVLWALSKAVGRSLAFAPEPIGSRADLFIEGASRTLSLTALSGLLGLGIGILLGLAKLSERVFLRWPADGIIAVLRGTPLLVQIMFIYYAVPALHPTLSLTDYVACVIALSLNVGAYNAEVIRGSILAIPRGQTEAARSLGFTPLQTMTWVVMPQSFRLALPPLINNLVALLKDSSLASSVGLLELSLAGNRISSETFEPVPVLTTIAVLYFLMTTVITFLASRLEKRFRVGSVKAVK